ncbi:MAG: GNAT family N-acetyltransferase [Planctomycetes bacterium]|nr:GNAT family N-acetyltransferase [Planctomycetota bacterium]
MIRYRPFRNTDPPAIAELWCNHPPHRALVQPMSPTLFEQRVLSKPYFDRDGLIVAEEEGRIVGFAHGGFGSSEDDSGVNTEIGATCMLMVGPHDARSQIANELLEASERYLTHRGARTLYAGSVFPANAFYLGLYGGCQSPGILESDSELSTLFRSAGYEETERHVIAQRKLAGFRPIVDRVQMQVRRQYQVEPEHDPPPDSWWEACTIGQIERMRYLLVSRRTGEVSGSVIFWDMERISSSWGVPSIGLMRLEIAENLRGQGLGVFLVGEALRHMHNNGALLAEARFVEGNRAAHALFEKLGFEQVDRGYVLCRAL